MHPDFTRHGGHDEARRRLLATYQTRGDVRFPDLLRYLDSVALEPTGVDAFKLAAVLRELDLRADQAHELLRDAQHWLRFRPATVDYKRQVQDWLTEAVRVAEQPRPLFAPEDGITDPADREKADLNAARAAGEQITERINEERRLQFCAVFAALAVAWLFVKPPREPEVYMDEAVRDFFPW